MSEALSDGGSASVCGSDPGGMVDEVVGATVVEVETGEVEVVPPRGRVVWGRELPGDEVEEAWPAPCGRPPPAAKMAAAAMTATTATAAKRRLPERPA
jgi:hypothetical protein